MIPDIAAAHRQMAESIAEFMRAGGPKPADVLIDKLWGSDRPLTEQERHDIASLLYAAQQACAPIDPGAMVRKAVRLDALKRAWAGVFGEQS